MPATREEEPVMAKSYTFLDLASAGYKISLDFSVFSTLYVKGKGTGCGTMALRSHLAEVNQNGF